MVRGVPGSALWALLRRWELNGSGWYEISQRPLLEKWGIIVYARFSWNLKVARYSFFRRRDCVRNMGGDAELLHLSVFSLTLGKYKYIHVLSIDILKGRL
jgi:hypothetical protein